MRILKYRPQESSHIHRRELFTRSLGALAAPLLLRAEKSSPPHSARAIDLVRGANVIDMLSLLTLNWPLLDRWRMAPGAFTEADFNRLKSSGINVFHPAVALESETSHRETEAWLAKWNRFIQTYPNYFLRIDQPRDLALARTESRIGIILGMQDANHFRTVNDVDAFYASGQRLTQLTYNSRNRLGAGCKAIGDKGLTTFGQEVVARMNSLGMAIDVSHCGERTSLDAIAASNKPVLITHSNCRALAPGVTRCKSDEVIRAAAAKGGVLGITSVRQFVRCSGPTTVESVLDHFDHAVKLVGIDHVGLGSDFDLDPHPSYDTPGLNDPDRVYELTDGLIRRGYTDSQISQLLGGNFERALREIWTVA